MSSGVGVEWDGNERKREKKKRELNWDHIPEKVKCLFCRMPV